MSGRVARIASALGGLGLVLLVVGALVDPGRAAASYLAAYAAVLSLALGALCMLMIARLTGARWFEPFRPVAEAVAGTLPLLALLFVPVALGVHRLYPWTRPLAELAPDVQQAILAKRGWLTVPFFLGRAVFYLVLWSAFALLMRRWRGEERRSAALSALALPPLALTLTFAAFDWLMSLSPAWWSTVYGVYWFAGGMVAALALLALVAALMPGGHDILPTRRQALGTLTFTFVIVWAYMGFSQYLIIWIADVPAEVAWYVPRVRGSWGWVAVLLVAGHFALPFLLLLFRDLKRHRRALAAVAVWLLVMHYVDVYWLVLPQATPGGVRPHWLDLAALLLVGGATAAWASVLGGRELAPVRPLAVEPRGS